LAYDEFEIDRVKHALGDLCHAWADLEDTCFTILFYMMQDSYTVWEFLRNELDFIRALEVCKAHAVGNNWEAHCDHIPILVEMIDKSVRTPRNRYVHDPVSHGPNSLIRTTHKTRYRKVPFKGIQVTGEYGPLFSEEIYALGKAVRALDSYAGAIVQYQDWLDGERHYPWEFPSMEIAQLGAHFAIAEYTHLTKSLGATL
jgi:hypothetical protein